MTLDGLTLKLCVKELQEKLSDAKIQKILMPGKEEVVLQLYSAGQGTLKLVLCADAGDCSLYLTSQNKPNPENAARILYVSAQISERCAYPGYSAERS